MQSSELPTQRLASEALSATMPPKPMRRKFQTHGKNPLRRFSFDQSLLEVKSNCHGHHHKPSRHWLMNEIKRLKEENETLQQQTTPETQQGPPDECTSLKRRLEESNNVRANLEKQISELLKANESYSQTSESQKKKIDELKQDVFILKNLVYRLNVELEKYQDKVRNLKNQIDATDDCHTVTEDSGVGDAKLIHQTAKSDAKAHVPSWTRSEIHAVAPLLKAYQESLDEKDELIQNYQKSLDTFAGRCKEIVAENEKLHAELQGAYKKGEVSYAEWESVQQDAAFTREQNVLLMRQAKLHQNKIKELREIYQTNLAEIAVDRDQLQEKWQTARSELLVLRGRFSVLSDEHDKLKEEHDSRVPAAVHTAAVNEVKRLFEELKTRYEEERETLCRKVATLECDRPQLDSQVTTLTIERSQFQQQTKMLEHQLKLYKAKCDQLQKHVKSMELSRIAAKRHLIRVMTFAREIIAEQEEFGSKSSNPGQDAHLNAKVESLRRQLREVEDSVSKELEFLDEKLRAKATGLNAMKRGLEQELQCLQAEVRQRDDVITELKKRSDEKSVDGLHNNGKTNNAIRGNSQPPPEKAIS
nr:PREDICTED: centrosomal protein of 89 kDa isoform X2 [Bemisia tabaci]